MKAPLLAYKKNPKNIIVNIQNLVRVSLRMYKNSELLETN